MRNEVEGGELAGDGQPFAAAGSASTSAGNGFTSASNRNGLRNDSVDEDEDDPFDALFDALQQDPSGIRKNPFAASNTDTFPNHGRHGALSEITSPPTPPLLSQNGAAEIYGNGSYAPFADPVSAEPDAFGSLAAQEPVSIAAEPSNGISDPFEELEAFDELDFSLEDDADLAPVAGEPSLFVPPPPPAPPHVAIDVADFDAQADAELEAAFAEEMPDVLDLDITFAPEGEADDELAAAFAEFDDFGAPPTAAPPHAETGPFATPRDVSLPPTSVVEAPEAEAELEAAFAVFDAFEDIDFDENFDAAAPEPAAFAAAARPPEPATLEPEATAAIDSIFTEFEPATLAPPEALPAPPSLAPQAVPQAEDEGALAESLVAAFADFLDDEPDDELPIDDDVLANLFGEDANAAIAAEPQLESTSSAAGWEISEPSGRPLPSEGLPATAEAEGLAPPAAPDEAWEVADFAELELEGPRVPPPAPAPNPFETGLESSFYRELTSQSAREPTAITSPWDTASAEQELAAAWDQQPSAAPFPATAEAADAFEIEMDALGDEVGPPEVPDFYPAAAFGQTFSPDPSQAPETPTPVSAADDIELSAEEELPGMEEFDVDVDDDFDVSFQSGEADAALEIEVEDEFDVDLAAAAPMEMPVDAGENAAELPIDISLDSEIDGDIEPEPAVAASEMAFFPPDAIDFDNAAEIPEFSFDDLLQNAAEPAQELAQEDRDLSPFAAQDTGSQQVSDSMLESFSEPPSELDFAAELPVGELAAGAATDVEPDPFARGDTGARTELPESMRDGPAFAETLQPEEMPPDPVFARATEPFAGIDTGIQETPFADSSSSAAEPKPEPESEPYSRQDTGLDFAAFEMEAPVPTAAELADFVAQDTDSHALNPSEPPDGFAEPTSGSGAAASAREAAAAASQPADPFAAQDTGLQEFSAASVSEPADTSPPSEEALGEPDWLPPLDPSTGGLQVDAEADAFAGIDTGIEDNPLASVEPGSTSQVENAAVDPFAGGDTGIEALPARPDEQAEDTSLPSEGALETGPDAFASVDTGIEDNPLASQMGDHADPMAAIEMEENREADPFAANDTGVAQGLSNAVDADAAAAEADSFASVDTGIEDNPFASISQETPAADPASGEVPFAASFGDQDSGQPSPAPPLPEMPVQPSADSFTDEVDFAAMDLEAAAGPRLDAELEGFDAAEVSVPEEPSSALDDDLELDGFEGAEVSVSEEPSSALGDGLELDGFDDAEVSVTEEPSSALDDELELDGFEGADVSVSEEPSSALDDALELDGFDDAEVSVTEEPSSALEDDLELDGFEGAEVSVSEEPSSALDDEIDLDGFDDAAVSIEEDPDFVGEPDAVSAAADIDIESDAPSETAEVDVHRDEPAMPMASMAPDSGSEESTIGDETESGLAEGALRHAAPAEESSAEAAIETSGPSSSEDAPAFVEFDAESPEPMLSAASPEEASPSLPPREGSPEDLSTASAEQSEDSDEFSPDMEQEELVLAEPDGSLPELHASELATSEESAVEDSNDGAENEAVAAEVVAEAAEAAPAANDGESNATQPGAGADGPAEEAIAQVSSANFTSDDGADLEEPAGDPLASEAAAGADLEEPAGDPLASEAAEDDDGGTGSAPAAASAALAADALDEESATETPPAAADPVAVDLFDDDPNDELTPLPEVEEPSVLPSAQSLDDFLEDMHVAADVDSTAAAPSPPALPAELSADQPFLSASGGFSSGENPSDVGFESALDSLDGFMAEMLGDSSPSSEAQAAESLDDFFHQLSGENVAANIDPFAAAAADPSASVRPPPVVPRETALPEIDALVEDAKEIDVAVADAEVELDEESPENSWTADQSVVSNPEPAGVAATAPAQAVATGANGSAPPASSAPPPSLEADEETDAVEDIEEETGDEESIQDDSSNPPSKKKLLLIAAAALVVLSLAGIGGYFAWSSAPEVADDIEALAEGESGEGEDEDEEKVADGEKIEGDEDKEAAKEKQVAKKATKKPKADKKEKEEALDSDEAALAALEALAQGKSLSADQVAALSDDTTDETVSDPTEDSEDSLVDPEAKSPDGKAEKDVVEDKESIDNKPDDSATENRADDAASEEADSEEEDNEEADGEEANRAAKGSDADGDESDDAEEYKDAPAPQKNALNTTPDLSKIPKKYRNKSMPVQISKVVDASDSEIPELSMSLREGFAYGLNSDGHARWKVGKKKQKKGHSVRLKTTEVSTKTEKQGVRVTVSCEAVTSKKAPSGDKKKKLIQAEASSSIDEAADYELTDQLAHSAAWACAHRLSKKMVAETLR